MVFFLVGLVGVQGSHGGTVYQADFDSLDFSPGSIEGQHGWWVDQGSATVLPGMGLNGSSSLSLSAEEPFSQARLSLLRPPGSGPVLFLDVWVLIPAGESPVFDESFDMDSARIGLFRSSTVSQAARWYVFQGDGDGGGDWLDTGVMATVEPITGFLANWTRLTVREDLASQTWDLWADRVLLAASIGFQYPPEADQFHFFVLGDHRLPILLDEVAISSLNPLGPDADSDGILDADDTYSTIASRDAAAAEPDTTDTDADGLPDAWETVHAFDPNDSSDAASDRDGDGLSALDEFTIGTDPAAHDVRKSIEGQTAAVFNRFAGVSTRRVVQEK